MIQSPAGVVALPGLLLLVARVAFAAGWRLPWLAAARRVVQSGRLSQRDEPVPLGIEVLAQQEPAADHAMERMGHLIHVVIERCVALFDGWAGIAGGFAFCQRLV